MGGARMNESPSGPILRARRAIGTPRAQTARRDGRDGTGTAQGRRARKPPANVVTKGGDA